MKRLLLGLLKLLLQLLIFAVAGKWVQFGDPPPKPSSRKQPQRAKPPKLPERAGRAPLFDRTRPRGAYEEVREPERTWRSVEQEAAEQGYEPRSIEVLARADEPRAKRGKRGKRKRRGEAVMSERRAKPPALPASRGQSTGPRGSLAAALRDPLRVRQALILGAALGPRRPRR